MLINAYTKTQDIIRLDLIHPNLSMLLRLIGWIDILTGLAWILGAFFTDSPDTSWLDYGIFGGFFFLFSGSVMNAIAQGMDAINTRFLFNTPMRMLNIQQHKSAKIYANLPKEFTFSQIKMLRLKIIRADQPAMAPYLVEIVLQDGKFIPLTAFKSEQKARAILQDLRMSLDKPVDETFVTQHNFGDYKRSFLQQFGVDVPEPKSRLNR